MRQGQEAAIADHQIQADRHDYVDIEVDEQVQEISQMLASSLSFCPNTPLGKNTRNRAARAKVTASCVRADTYQTVPDRRMPRATPAITGPRNDRLPPIIIATTASSNALSPPLVSNPMSKATIIATADASPPASPKAMILSRDVLCPRSAISTGLSASARNRRPRSLNLSQREKLATRTTDPHPATICARVMTTAPICTTGSRPVRSTFDSFPQISATA